MIKREFVALKRLKSVPHTAGSFPEAEKGQNNKPQHQEQNRKSLPGNKHQIHYGECGGKERGYQQKKMPDIPGVARGKI